MSLSQRGNAFFIILLCIALFSALAYAVSQSMRGGGKDASPEQVSAALGEVQHYASTLTNTIQELKTSNDCTDAQINLETSAVSTYANLGAPSDNSCDVFVSAGGPVPWQDPPSFIFPKASGDFWRTSYAYTAQVAIPQIGTTKSDLLLTMEVKDAAQCSAINKIIDGNSGTPPAATSYCFEPYAGVFDNAAGCAVQNWTNVSGKPQYCVGAGGDQYYYYNVILAR